MHSNVIIKNVSWPHFSWPTLYMLQSVRTTQSRTRTTSYPTFPGHFQLTQQRLIKLRPTGRQLARCHHL